ncbi:MAG TPA: alkaline phosphatase family protein [Vicinamibacterales bacterium]|nr:alkaline phosphatase family protein [Vicinamibacterales bacterium]
MSSNRDRSRRQFLCQLGAGVGGAALVTNPLLAQLGAAALPSPQSSGIEHIVVVTMENRSFDHYLGWVKGADGRNAGLRYVDNSGTGHRTFRLAPDYQGCGHPDPDHSYDGGRVEFNNGACDGWLRAGQNDLYAIGYYTEGDLPFFSNAVADWTVCDRYFSAIMAPTFPNRFYTHAAQTDRLTNSFELSLLPTIWDSLASAGLEGRYYFNDVPFLALWGSKYLPISRPFDAFLADCSTGTLPQVSFVDPRFVGEEFGLSGDDHPHADIRNGQAFLNQIYRAVTTSPAWASIVLVITYDEWGGFFEHVPPPTGPIPAADAAAGNADGLLGFRVPTFVISPFARRKYVAHATLDHTSILKMIEWRWNLPSLTARDANALNLAEILDFARPRLRPAGYNVPVGNIPTLCLPTEVDKWVSLAALARGFGWGT